MARNRNVPEATPKVVAAWKHILEQKMTHDELFSLNHTLVTQLRHQQRHQHRREAAQAMDKLEVGKKYCFDSRRHGRVTITLTSFNSKTVSGVTELGARWKVSPSLLKAVA